MSDLDTNLKKILHARYGEDVRQAIHDAISAVQSTSGSGGSSVQIDATLTKSGQAADAKTVGDRITNITGNQLYRGLCSTGSNTSAKAVNSVSGFSALTANAAIAVRFTYTVTGTVSGTDITLNVNSTGAKVVMFPKGVSSAYGTDETIIASGGAALFIYNGGQWICAGVRGSNTGSSVSTNAAYGTQTVSNSIATAPATTGEIDTATQAYKPITPATAKYAVEKYTGNASDLPAVKNAAGTGIKATNLVSTAVNLNTAIENEVSARETAIASHISSCNHVVYGTAVVVSTGSWQTTSAGQKDDLLIDASSQALYRYTGASSSSGYTVEFVTSLAGSGGSSVQIDATLTKSGQAADAKTVGDRIGNLNNLETTTTASLVAAINELAATGNGTVPASVLDDIDYLKTHKKSLNLSLEWEAGSIDNNGQSYAYYGYHLRTALFDSQGKVYVYNPTGNELKIVEYDSNGTFIQLTNEGTAENFTFIPSSNCAKLRIEYYNSGGITDDDRQAVEEITFMKVEEDYDEWYSAKLYPSLAMFPTFGVIGDSYASGVVPHGTYNNETSSADFSDRYLQSWGQLLARKYGTRCTNFSHSGVTTKSFCEGHDTTRSDNAYCLDMLLDAPPLHIYYLCLGINDYGNKITLGTAADIDTKASTFYGYYARIIETIQDHAPNAKMIMFTCTLHRDSPEDAAVYNAAIINIANHYGIPYIVQDDDALLNAGYFVTEHYSGHPSMALYAAMAEAFDRLIRRCVYEHSSYFFEYQMSKTPLNDDYIDKRTFTKRAAETAKTIYGDSSAAYTAALNKAVSPTIDMTANDIDYHYYGYNLTAITVTIDAAFTGYRMAAIKFETGSSPTVFTYPESIKWQGADCEDYVFVPEANTYYDCMIEFSNGIGIGYVASTETL